MKPIVLGKKTAQYPLLQGGMGVGVSMHSLAGHVSKAGGIGVLSTADIGYRDPEFFRDPLASNLRAIGEELKKARAIAGPNKIIGANVMVALKHYDAIVKECVRAKVDLIISGAGIPLKLPAFVKGTQTKIAPIVSSLRCLKLIVKQWKKKYDYTPDLVVIEGPQAGGHLGFSWESLKNGSVQSLEEITREIVPFVRDLEKTEGTSIPVICAGGIWDRADVLRMEALGADGVQIATRLIATEECDASLAMKEAYVRATADDISLIHSPVGMPGRAIKNAFLEKVAAGHVPISHCARCIHTCNPSETPYCITQALTNAVKGDIANGLLFCGTNVDKIDHIGHVNEIIEELMATPASMDKPA